MNFSPASPKRGNEISFFSIFLLILSSLPRLFMWHCSNGTACAAFSIWLSALRLCMTLSTQRPGGWEGNKAKRRIKLPTKKGENSSFNAERMSYRHNLANPAPIWFVSRAAAHRFWLMPNQVPTGPLTPLGVCMRSVEGHEKKFYHIFLSEM